MSFANYLTGDPTGAKTASFNNVYISSVPTDLDDGARVVDSIRFASNATYPAGTQTVISPSATGYVPLFMNDVSEGDYLRIKTDLNNPNFEQLANLEYKIRVKGSSMDKFNVRFSVYDGSLNLVQAYDPVEYDPSQYTHQSVSLSTLALKGFSVDYPSNGVYGFMEISGDGVGSITGEFDYAYSDLQASYITSRGLGQVGNGSTKNIFALDLDDLIIDASSFAPQIQALQADVLQLQADVSAIDVSLASLENTKVSKSGDTMTGTLVVGGQTYPASGWREAIQFPQGALLIEGADVCDNYCAGIGVYSDISFEQHRDLYFWAGAYAGNQRKANWEDAMCVMSENTGIKFGDIVNLDGNRITGLGAPQTDNDAVSRGYVAGEYQPQITDVSGRVASNTTALGTKLPLAGGTLTGQLSMNGNRITSVATPIQQTDSANKGYVDSKVSVSRGDIIPVWFAPNTSSFPSGQPFSYELDSASVPPFDKTPSPPLTANGSYYIIYDAGGAGNSSSFYVGFSNWTYGELYFYVKSRARESAPIDTLFATGKTFYFIPTGTTSSTLSFTSIDVGSEFRFMIRDNVVYYTKRAL